MPHDDAMPWRRDALGGSDAPAICGVDPFQTAGDVWAKKTGRVPSTRANEAGEVTPMALGSAIGPLLVAHAGAQLRRRIVQQEVWYRHPTAPMAVSVDGLATEAPGVLIEAKTAGLLGPLPAYALAYGDDGTDDVPAAVNVQVHHAFAVLAAQPELPPIREAIVPVLLGGRGVHCYRITRDDQLVEQLLALETEWWADHVVADRCPTNDPPSLAILRDRPRVALGPPVPLDPIIVNEWLAAKMVAKQAAENEEHIRRMILSALGDGETGECDLGRVTYTAQQRAAYTVAAQTIRVLRWQPAGGKRR
jgi:predicted phage-related endonuclease